PLPQSPAEKQKFQSLLSKISDGEMRSIVIEAAMDNLPDLIRDLFCESNPWRNPSPWYCPDLLSVLIDAMELHARRVEQQWAHTEIFKIIFDRIDYSVTEKRLVKIVGQARTGKTEACEAFAKAYPGRVRLVSTPPGNSKRDLFMAIGEAFGIPLTAVNALARIGETVQYIVRHGRLGIIFDEAQFLLPSPGSHVHTPARLDWIRCNVIDRKLPCVLVCTPQTFNHFVRDLRDKRGYNFDQVLGRIDLNVNLPDTLEKDDLAEILRTHGAGIPQKLQPFLLSAVLINGKKDSLVKAFEAVCCRARHLARRDGSRAISQADLETAVSEVIPAGAAPAATVPTRSGRTRQTVSGRLTNSPAPEMRPEREITPVSGAAPAREIRPLTNQPA
ncbi:MAG TPA: ATP-binding protein, partial [Verrucomicrobiae bacterium]|nr:ATP-binding protein [Verrucomicrobiae bacterium]